MPRPVQTATRRCGVAFFSTPWRGTIESSKGMRQGDAAASKESTPGDAIFHGFLSETETTSLKRSEELQRGFVFARASGA